jgi:exodeoxyribonuclease III
MAPITIASWNVNGARAIARKGLAEWLLGAGVDVLALQETKAAPEQLPTPPWEALGYHADWCVAERAGYSGVATISRQRPLAVGRGLDDARFDGEGRVLISQFAGFTLYNVYAPSGSSGMERVAYKLLFYARLTEVIAAAVARGERIVLVGDLNTAYAPIDLARPRENQKTSGFLPEERAALGALYAAGLVDTFRHRYPEQATYSWWSQRSNVRERNIGWRIDYALVSPNLLPQVVDAGILCEVMGSDHCPVTLTLEV